MKAEISNFGIPGGTRVSGVYLQQGRMITDRDWNALCDALSARLAETTDATLADAAPRRGGLLANFRRAGTQWTADFRAGGGTVAAEGRIGAPAPFNPDREFTWLNQRDLPSLTEAESDPDFLYVDVWDQTLTAFALPDLLDVALHGADTAFVTRRVAQIKAATKEMLEETECGLRLAEAAAPRIGTALAEVELRDAAAGDDRCDPCAITVDVEASVENSLWRLEAHAVRHAEDGMATQVVLKWSADNGAVQWKRPAGFDHATLDVGYAYEFFNDETELHLGLPPEGYGSRPDQGDLRHADLSDAPDSYDRIRQWDGWCLVDLVDDDVLEGWDRGRELASDAPAGHGQATCKDGVVTLELERLTVTVNLGDVDPNGRPRRVLAGDHWLALSRDRAPEGAKVRMLSPTPVGLRHDYCLLGEPAKELNGVAALSPADKRRLSHPSLGCLRAEDVGYDNSDCAWARDRGAYNVQDALDAFCERLQAPYIVLKPSSGTGQTGPVNAFLTCPAIVVAEDQNGRPAKNVRITFAVPRHGDDRVATTPGAGAPTDREVTVDTDETGHAICWWWLGASAGGFPGPGLPGRARAEECHLLRAFLADEPPQRVAAEVRFTAQIAQKISPPPAVDFPTVKRISWENDNLHRVDDFIQGIEIGFSEAVQIALFSDDIVIVAADDYSSIDDRYGASASHPYIFHCICSEGPENAVRVKPAVNNPQVFKKWVETETGYVKERGIAPGVRVRVRLLGRAAFDQTGETIDGFVPGAPHDNGTIALDFGKAGVGHPSDFESWFYLIA